MAKKRKRRRASMLTKAINVGILGLALSVPIDHFLLKGRSVEEFVGLLTGGLSQGQNFDVNKALIVYTPMIGAVLLKKGISMVRKTARV